MTVDQDNSSFALLTDGGTIEIRAARPTDVEPVREMHELMSAENAYLRFFGLSGQMAAREALRVCREPGPDHAALLAWFGGRLVGVASYEPTGRSGEAEVALAVSDDMHRRGVGTLLLEHLVSRARRRGLRAFTASTLPENAEMLRVFAGAGLPVQRQFKDGVVELTFPLPGPQEDARLGSYLDRVAARASRAGVASLRHLLRPDSVAVIGASRSRGTVGREILRNIVTAGYAGAVYPVNPRARLLEGLRCLPDASKLPDGVELAVLAVPAAAVPKVAAECGRRGVQSLVVISSDLGEAGVDLLATCRRYGMRLAGPNCFGVAVPEIGLNATFAPRHPAPGAAGLVVQSGGLGISMLEHLTRLGIGVSSFASVGDKLDVSSNDMLVWWEQDGSTRLAVLYVESFGNPRAFARTARRVGRQIPILTVVGGRSAAGQRAAQSHTAASATPLVTQEALFAQAGVIATHSLGELIEAAALVACQPLPAGRRVAIVSNAGGSGVLAADACTDNNLSVAALSATTQRKLARRLAPGAVVSGPVDTGAAVTGAQFRYCLETIAADEGVDAVLAIAVPTAVCDLTAAIKGSLGGKTIATVVLDQAESVRVFWQPAGEPDAASPAVTGAPGARGAAGRGGVPAYAFPEAAARALARAVSYREWRDHEHGSVPEFSDVDLEQARSLVAGFLSGNHEGGWLTPREAVALLGCYRIPLVPSRHAADEQTAVAAAAELGGRVVLKADVTGLVHKTEAGAVKLDLRGHGEVSRAYRELAERFGRTLDGVQVQPMLVDGTEVLIGVVQEPVFGPLVVFGLGGVATEVLGDHVARLTPLTDTDAAEMIGSVRAARLLAGHRGRPAADIAALSDVLLRVSRLADDLPEVAELDLNPVIARPDGVYPVDVRIRITPAAPRDPFLRQLR